MIRRLKYEEQRFRDSERCLAEMGARLEGGWEISAVQRRARGEVSVIFRFEGQPGRAGGDGRE